QARTSSVRFGPRIATVWTPLPHDPMIVRTGYGVFYDRVPLGIYSFGSHPEQMVTSFDPSGVHAPVMRNFSNVIDTDSSERFPLVARGSASGNFSPHGKTWTAGMERPVGERFHLRINYQHSTSGGGILLTPETRGDSEVHVLSAGGQSIYRQLEITARTSWKGGQQMLFSYV